MATGSFGKALRRTLLRLGGAGETADGQLLERFAAQRDEAAFEELMRRHGPMVMRLCRRLLRDNTDIEDTFQAAFVVLARRAGSVRKHESVASWLYKVAYRIAIKARCKTVRRRVHERSLGETVADLPGPPSGENPGASDLRPMLDEELGRLPERYRAPIVLCYLEGRSTDEAAAELGLARGTVASRMSRARDLLRKRLARRGIGMPAAMLATALASEAATAAVPAAFTAATVRGAVAIAAGEAAAATLSPSVLALAHGALRHLVLRRLVLLAGCLVALAVFGGIAWLARLGTTEPGANDGRLRSRWTIPAEGGYATAFSSNGRLLTVAPVTGSDGPVRVIDAATGRVHSSWQLPDRTIIVPVMSPNGKQILVQWWDKRNSLATRLLDAATGKEVRSFPIDRIGGKFSFSPDGKKVADQTMRGSLEIWDVATGNKQEFFGDGRAMTPCSGAFSPDWRLWAVAEASSANQVRVFDLQTGKQRAVFRTSGDREVCQFAFSSDGMTLVAGLRKRTSPYQAEVRLWDVATERALATYATVKHLEYGGFAVFHAVSPNGRQVVVASEGRFAAYEIATGKKVALFGTPGERPSAFFSPNGQWLVTQGSDEFSRKTMGVKLWRVPSFEEQAAWPQAAWPKGERIACFSPDSRSLLIGSEKTLELWDIADK